MPTIEAFIVEAYSPRQKQDLITAVTGAVVDAIAAPVDSIRVILNEVGAHDAGIGGASLASGGSGAPAVLGVVRAVMIAGRTHEQKRRLIAGLTDVVAALPGAEREAIRIIIQDIPNTDFGIAGKTAQALGRGIDRSAMAR